MLVLTRKMYQRIIIDTNICMYVSGLLEGKYIIDFITPLTTFICRSSRADINLLNGRRNSLLFVPGCVIIINKNIFLQVSPNDFSQYKFSFEAPDEISIWREELLSCTYRVPVNTRKIIQDKHYGT